MNQQKDNAKYWADRVYFHEPGKGIRETEYSIKIQHAARRERFKLNTTNREIAGGLALEIYRTLTIHGWDRAIAEFKKPMKRRPSTSAEMILNLYIRALRKIVNDIEKLNPDNLHFRIA